MERLTSYTHNINLLSIRQLSYRNCLSGTQFAVLVLGTLWQASQANHQLPYVVAPYSIQATTMDYKCQQTNNRETFHLTKKNASFNKDSNNILML